MDTRKSLFKINKDIQEILENPDLIDQETGEINEEQSNFISEQLEKLRGEKSEKIYNIGSYIRFLVGQEPAYKAEKKRIEEANNRRKKLIERLKAYILDSMDADKTDRYIFETSKITRHRGQFSLEFQAGVGEKFAEDVTKAEENLKTIKAAHAIDKKALKDKLIKQVKDWEESPDPDKEPLPEWVDGARVVRKPYPMFR